MAVNDAPQDICPTLFMSGTNVSCYGDNDGYAQVIATSGSGNYTYTWSNGINTNTNPGLPVGTYSVNVKDNVTGCTIIGVFVVGSPDPISTGESVTNVLCFGDNTGSVDVTTIGGSGAYNFTWSNGVNTEDLTSVVAGVYTLDISDANGCTYSESYTITQPLEALSGSAVVDDALCFGSPTGEINLDVWGGTPSYAYAWSSGQTTQDVVNLPSGAYSVLVTDLNGCSINLPYNIGQPVVLSGTVGSTDVLCYGDPTGIAYINPTGGTTPYSYSWQNSVNLFSDNSSTLVDVPADTYQVTVTDDNGCVLVENVDVLQPSELIATNTFVNVSCYGGSDGSINVSVTGGIPIYSYAWTNSLGNNVANTEDLLNIPAEYYDLIVTDNNGCTTALAQEVLQPLLPISVETVVVDVLCFGENTGSIDLTASGGTPPFTYSWTSGQTTEDVTNMLAGTFGYTVIDNNGCTESGSETIIQPLAPIAVTYVVTDVNCFDESNGSIDLTVTGGTPTYTYSWTNSTFSLSYTNEDLINFPADSYRYEITDANGCTLADTIDINEPTELVLSINPTHILCYGEFTGETDLTATGGIPPYSYLWSNGPTTEDQTGLPAGYYEATVTDDNNCVSVLGAQLTQPLDTISWTADVSDVHCNNGTNGEIDLFVSGGTIPYNYLWSNGQTSNTIESLTAGFHAFEIIDGNGCYFTDSVYVDQPDPFLTNEVVTPVSCYGGEDGIIDITPTGGTPPFAYAWFNSTYALADQSEDLIGYVADMYQLEIVDSNGCFYEVFIDLPEPDSLIVDATIKQVTCYGGDDGAVFIDITGGNPGYTTTWSDGTLTEDLVDVISDTFQLIVVDTKGCTDTIDYFVPQPDSMYVTFDHDPATCIDQVNGVAYAFPVGGNGGYIYDWSNGGIEETAGGLSTGWHYLTLTDVLGCEAYDSVFVTYIDGPCIDPPTAFTPNGDLYNDDWRIDNVNIYPQLHVEVFNKWGNKIHEQLGGYEPWDGTINGVQAPSETYYWVIHLNYLNRESVRGNVTILR